MRHKLLLTTLVAASVAASATLAMAQAAPPSSPGGSAAGTPGVSPATPPSGPPADPPSSASRTTGVNNQPGVPNTSTPGSIGTGASPSGLPGDSTSNPGYPAPARR